MARKPLPQQPEPQPAGRDPAAPPQPRARMGTQVWESRDLFCGCEYVEINHNGTRYRLHVTRQGKLILTK